MMSSNLKMKIEIATVVSIGNVFGRSGRVRQDFLSAQGRLPRSPCVSCEHVVLVDGSIFINDATGWYIRESIGHQQETLLQHGLDGPREGLLLLWKIRLALSSDVNDCWLAKKRRLYNEMFGPV